VTINSHFLIINCRLINKYDSNNSYLFTELNVDVVKFITLRDSFSQPLTDKHIISAYGTGAFAKKQALSADGGQTKR